MTGGNRWRMRVALDVGQWMKLAPLQADVLEWVLPRHRILAKTSGTRLPQKPTEGPRSLLGGAVHGDRPWRRFLLDAAKVGMRAKALP
jgi:hypothetical protein